MNPVVKVSDAAMQVNPIQGELPPLWDIRLSRETWISSENRIGAGDGNRTRDQQLGKQFGPRRPESVGFGPIRSESVWVGRHRVVLPIPNRAAANIC